ncbi:MAG: tryptophan synthase subunit alpha [Elusimicrobiota bacterium]
MDKFSKTSVTVYNKLDQVFIDLKAKKQKALIAYLAAGYPQFQEERTLIKTLQVSGVDILELGIPFSDPIADGPTIQYASQESLNKGTTLKKIIAWVKSFKEIHMPIVFMGYLNPLLAYGLEKFAKDAASIGVCGLIVPDVIPEEAASLRTILSKYNIHLIHLIAPTTPLKRSLDIKKKTSGFLYAVSVAGVTGARKNISSKTKDWIASLKKNFNKPLCVGFGISTPEHIKFLKSSADGFIVGSALIDIIRKNKPQNRNVRLKEFVSGLSKECKRGSLKKSSR